MSDRKAVWVDDINKVLETTKSKKKLSIVLDFIALINRDVIPTFTPISRKAIGGLKRLDGECGCAPYENCGCKVEDYNQALDDVLKLSVTEQEVSGEVWNQIQAVKNAHPKLDRAAIAKEIGDVALLSLRDQGNVRITNKNDSSPSLMPISREVIQEIIAEELLDGWNFELTDSSDGLCLHDTKKLFIGKQYKPTLMLALHEIAHAQCSKEEDGHNNIWVGKYEKLMRKYMFNQEK